MSATSAAPAAADRAQRWRLMAQGCWPVLAALGFCPLVAALAPRGPATPVDHARELVGLEWATGTHVEGSLVHMATRQTTLRAALGFSYMWMHLPAVVGVLVWVALEHPASFPSVRDTFAFVQCLTAALFVLLPTASPWMLSAHPPPDVLAGGLVYWLQSRFAAMPSGRVVSAAVAGGSMGRLARRRSVRVLALAYPPLVAFVILATGRRLGVDVAAGAAVAGAGAGAAACRRAIPREAR